MALSCSVDKVDENGKEMLSYGSAQFPIAFFDDDLRVVSVPYHWHEEFEFVVITMGRVRARIGGRELTLEAGDGYFTNAGVLHAADLQTQTGHQHALVFGPTVIAGRQDLAWREYVQPILGNRDLPFARLSSSVPWQKEVLRLAESAWEHGAYEKKDYPLVVRYCLGLAFGHLIEHREELETGFHYTDGFRRDELRIKKALTFIEQNYDSAVTLEDIADSANIGVSSCLRLFHSVLGTTPGRFLVKTRLRKSMEELTRGESRTISEIAYSCGFSDASYFNRCFRREYGKTPSEYFRGRREES
jgi:Transcriptional regulator containing an amidase domain and an AraC-type DNA-binding HTH domain